jgi:fumarate reductase subunit D
MRTWVAVAIGCGATIISFVAMVLLLTLAVYLVFGTFESEYNSSPSNLYYVIGASPFLLLASVILGVIVAFRRFYKAVPAQKSN